ncbi:MAG: PD-(D/E)XK nuclease family protein [Methanothrix sp.]
MIYVDMHLQKVFIANILGSATQKELGPFYPLKDSLGLVGFVAEAVIEAKDDGEAALMARLANDTARSLVQFALEELKVSYGANLFDTFDAYCNIDAEEIRDYVASRFGKRLFLDGFTNLSWAQMIFLSKIIPMFHETFMTLDQGLADGKNWPKFQELLASQSVEVREETLTSQSVEVREETLTSSPSAPKLALPLERLLMDQGPPANLEGEFIQIACHSDPEAELIQVCRDIKRRIVDDGQKPGEIAVVLNNFSERAREFSRKLLEYGIPVRVSGEEPLSSSIAVQLLVLPLRAALAGYPSHLLISMLDHGLCSAATADFDLDNLEGLTTGAGLHMGPGRASLKDRRDEWHSKLEEHLAALKERLETLKQDDSVYDSDLLVQQSEIQLCQDLMQKSEQLFQSLERIEAARESQADLKFYKDELASWMAPLKDRFLNNPELVSETMALGRFEHIFGQLEVMVSTIGKRVLTLAKFMAFLEILLSSEEFRPSPPLANTVEILSLHSARFKHRRLKYIVNFNDDIFPARRANPLYSLEDLPFREPGYYKIKEREQRVALYSCLCASSEVMITYPVASREGEPMVPSLWLDGWSFDKAGSREKLASPMSAGELKNEFAYRLANQADTIIPDDVLELLLPLKIYADSKFSWKIGERAVVDSLAGRKFSYTKLSEFKSCPFKFFLRRIMRLEEQSDDLYALSPLELGSCYHAVLKNLYDLKQEGMDLDEANKSGRVRHEVEAITQRFLAANKIRSLPAVREAMINGATARVQTYLEFELFTPEKAFIGERTLTEIPFSIQLAKMADIVCKSAQKYTDMVFLGRIDRIDLNVTEAGKGKGKKIYDMVLSDYKSSSAGDWDQLKLYTLALLSLDHEALPKNPALMRSFFRIIKGGSISLKLDAFPEEGRMEMHGQGKKILTFSDIDTELLATLDGIFEARQFLPGAMDGKANNCYFCGFKQNCEPLQDLRGGS